MPYRVYGNIRRNDNGTGLGGLLVKAYDVDWISNDDYLGSATTAADGSFSISFNQSAFDAGWYDPEGGPDIIVKVYSGGRLIYQSAERSGAGQNTYFDIRLNPLDLLGQYTVSGRVRDSRSGRLLCNLKVKAYDDDFLFDDYLGSTTTDHSGNYLEPYTQANFDNWLEGRPDPYVKILNNAGQVLARSNTIEEANRHSTINVWIGAQNISHSVSECVYGWTAAYTQEGTHIIVRIRLVPDDGITNDEMNTLRTTWKNGIEQKWSNRFASCCTGCSSRRNLTFEVLWVNSDQHHTVRVRRGPARSNMLCWDTQDSADVASHEFGHMLGLVDEYSDATCPGRSPVNTGTIMDDNSEVIQRHVEHLCSLYNQVAGPIAGAPPESPVSSKSAKSSFGSLEKPAMCLNPDLNARKQLATTISSVLKSESKLTSKDSITLTISGGVPSKRKNMMIELSGTGAIKYRNDDQMTAQSQQFSASIGAKTLNAFLSDIKKSGLLDLKQAGGPFLPDSEVATVAIELNGKKTFYYFLADKDQRRDQDTVLTQPIAALYNNFLRLSSRVTKRDETLQKAIAAALATVPEKKSKK